MLSRTKNDDGNADWRRWHREELWLWHHVDDEKEKILEIK